MALRTDYKDDILSSGNLRKYQMINNGDGTVSFQDVTVYQQTGDTFGAGDINNTNQAVNEKLDSDDVVDPMETTKSGFAADALAVKNAINEQNKKLNNNFNEMADVVDLEKQTQPYIVQKDGLLTATLNSSTTQWGYGNVSINGIIRGQVQNISNSATAMGITFEVYKGDVLTWESGSGGSVFLGIHYRK